jgi:hypothetical protein
MDRTPAPSPHSLASIFGGIGYPASHPGRWAGYSSAGTATLTVEAGCIVLSPLWPWRRLLRMPVLRIPLAAVETVTRITFGIRFAVPGEPELDGARFRRWYGGGRQLQQFVEFLQERGVPVQTMPRAKRVRGFVRDFAVAQRPGWIWRDRGRLAFLESGVELAAAVAVLLAVGVLSDLPTPMLIWLGFIVCVIVWGWFAGHRYRKKFRQQRR